MCLCILSLCESRCGLCDTYYIAHVKNACAFLGDGMSRIKGLKLVVHDRGRKGDSVDETYFGVFEELLYARKIKPIEDNTANEDEQGKPDASDIYSQAMGKERHGRVHMYRLGVAPSDIWGETPSRATSHRKAVEWKTACEQMEEKFQNLNNQFMELRPLVSQGKVQEEISYDGSSSQSQHYTLHSLAFNQKSRSLQVRDRVLLKSIANSTKIVANGVIHSIDPSTKVGGEELRPN